MAGHPAFWFILYGIIIPMFVLGISLYTGWGGILAIMGVLLWTGFAVAMLSPRESE